MKLSKTIAVRISVISSKSAHYAIMPLAGQAKSKWFYRLHFGAVRGLWRNASNDVNIVTKYKSPIRPFRAHSWIWSEVSYVAKTLRLFSTKYCLLSIKLVLVCQNPYMKKNTPIGARKRKLNVSFFIVSVAGPNLYCWRFGASRTLNDRAQNPIFFLQVMDIWLLFLPPVFSWWKS